MDSTHIQQCGFHHGVLEGDKIQNGENFIFDPLWVTMLAKMGKHSKPICGIEKVVVEKISLGWWDRFKDFVGKALMFKT